jgi:hypothetical protein
MIPKGEHFFEMGNAQFFENFEVEGENKVRNNVFEEKSISLPIVVSRHVQVFVLNSVYKQQPAEDNVEFPSN